MKHNKVCWPVWLPRTDPIILEADRRSRMTIPHDERTPQAVVNAANKMAVEIWRAGLSFDQAASRRSSVRVDGRRLPFNAYCMQPGASGVDTFRCWQSWITNINFVHPPAPMVGRLASFLPSTRARVVLVIPAPLGQAWWHYAIQPSAAGFRGQIVILGFLVTAFDFAESDERSEPAHSGLTTTACMECTQTTPH